MNDRSLHIRLFAYGTLMVKEIMALVAGGSLEATPARLHGYRRNLLRGQVYPGIRPDPQHRVDGVLYTGLTQNALHRLDLFEGDMYCRQSTRIELPDRQKVSAETYVLRPEHYACLSESSWDLDNFIRTGRDIFVAEYAGMAKIHGKQT